MKSMLRDYVSTYQDTIEPAKIIELFREAQQIAIDKLNSCKNQTSADGTAIYGYGESTGGQGYDTYTAAGDYYTVQSVLIEVMYEMERLISKEVLGMS